MQGESIWQPIFELVKQTLLSVVWGEKVLPPLTAVRGSWQPFHVLVSHEFEPQGALVKELIERQTLGSSRVRVWRAQLSSEEKLTWTQLASGTCCHVPIWQPFLAFNLIIDQTVTDTDRPRARPHPCPRVLVSVSAWHCYPAACHGNVSTERAHIVWIVITNNRQLPPLLLPLPVLLPLLPIIACLPLPSARLCRHVDVKLLSSCGLNGSAENLAEEMREEGRQEEAGTGGGRQEQKEEAAGGKGGGCCI